MKLASIPSRSTLSRPGYGVTVIGGRVEGERRLYRQPSSGSSGPMSKLEASIGEYDSAGSEENIVPLHVQSRAYMPKERERDENGITRTFEVMVSR